MLSRLSTLSKPSASVSPLRTFSAAIATTTPAASESGGKSTKLWGGRFSKDTAKEIQEWTTAVYTDKHMVAEDIWGSMAHVTMLGHQKIIPATAAGSILQQLLKLQNGFLDGTWNIGFQQEDVHMNVEAKMIEALGMDVGGRMHTCRSRNDQVVLDSKLYARKRLLELREKLVPAVQAFLDKAKLHTEDVMAGYTHVQQAQPISVAYWLSHYAAILLRDLDRVKRAYDITDENPLGAGALAGTSFPIDRTLTTSLLGFQKIHEHGLDATSARDFMLEALSSASILMTTISRLAEEFVLWSSWEFRSITLDDGFAMGSSMMPNKKNPGTCELLRGRAGRINGYLSAGLTMMKGLPSGYNRDFHEDKEVLINSLSLIIRAVEVLPPLIQTTQLNLARMAELANANFSTATELANYLVLRHNVPFRQAHHIVGSLVGDLTRRGENFSNTAYCFEHLKKNGVNAPEKEVLGVLDPKQVVLSYNSQGGTGPKAVNAMLRQFETELENHKKVLAADKARVDGAFNDARTISSHASSIKTAEDIAALVKKYHKRA
eukprot:TRINITY_DN4468_c0_g1_i1.p1 TRINITY_DN4468_c0_g1~~TRINITY_DN4468_c0_g1_i1.p1  ORF type:complete len:548 (+),score=157.46 TRINITY_DN4468_c0_g1_i1:35-1678(+)